MRDRARPQRTLWRWIVRQRQPHQESDRRSADTDEATLCTKSGGTRSETLCGMGPRHVGCVQDTNRCNGLVTVMPGSDISITCLDETSQEELPLVLLSSKACHSRRAAVQLLWEALCLSAFSVYCFFDQRLRGLSGWFDQVSTKMATDWPKFGDDKSAPHIQPDNFLPARQGRFRPWARPFRKMPATVAPTCTLNYATRAFVESDSLPTFSHHQIGGL